MKLSHNSFSLSLLRATVEIPTFQNPRVLTFIMFIVCDHKCTLFVIKENSNELGIEKGNRKTLNSKWKEDSMWLTALLLIKHAKRKPENTLLIRIAYK